MKSQPTNLVASKILKRQSSSGSLGIYNLGEEKNSDKILMLFVEIEASDKDNETIIDLLKEELARQFFHAPTETMEYAFENALAKANISVKDILLSKPKNWLKRMHIAAVAICGEEIHIAPVGSMHAFLVHQQKIADVLKSPQPAPTPNPVKLFTNIVSGKLGLSNTIVLINESVLDYLSIERIRKCANEYAPEEAVLKLSELLSRAPENKQFGLSVIGKIYRKKQTLEQKQDIKETNIYEKITGEEQKQEALAYEEEFIGQEEQKNRLKEILTFISRSIARLKPYALSALSFLLDALYWMLEKLRRVFAASIPVIGKSPVVLATIWKNRGARKYHANRAKEAAKKAISKMSDIRRSRRGIIGIAIFLLTAVFITSISFKAKEKEDETIITNTQNQISIIEQKISEAEAALIYENKAGALALLLESENLLAGLSVQNPVQNEKYQHLRTTAIELRNKAEGKRALGQLAPFATILPTPISDKETGLAATKDALLFFDGVQEKISRIDANQGLLLTIPLENQGIESFNTALALSGNEIAALRKDAVQIINIEKETINKQKFSFDPESSNRLAAYSGNLYSYDKSNNQIIRHRRAGAGFTSAQNWLSQEYDLTIMADIAVDGFVYLIDTQGNIHVFLRGKFNKRIPWPVNNLPGQQIRLYTNEDINSFYVLDSKNERVVRMTKNGELIEQITAEELKNAVDLIVDEGELNLYISSSDKIYKIPLN